MQSIRAVLEYAVSVNASDVHLVAGEKPVFRQYGDLVAGGDEYLSIEFLLELIEEMLPAHARDQFHHHHEADFSIEEASIGRFRVNAFMERGKPSLALRLVKTDIPTFEELGLPPVLGDIALGPSGIVLVSGSTGSGKSTTIARMIQHVNENASHRIITIEDPIEFVFHNKRSVVLQREIGSDTDSFTKALRSVVRQDPDIIMIGEMRDADSFSAALAMAETGHMVVSTLHTDTAAQSITRILNFFPPDQRDVVRMSLAVNLRGVLCQRLVHAIDGGLRPMVEIMVCSPIVKKLIETNQLEKVSTAIETGGEDGMQTFNQHIFQMINEGVITEEVGLRNATSPDALKMLLAGIDLQGDNRLI